MKPVKKIAIIHDICGVGKAALTNIMPILSVMGIEACPIPTYLLSTHTGGYGKPVMYSVPNFAKESAIHYKREGISFDAVLVGYLGSREAIESAIDFIEQFLDAEIIVDPIFGDNGRYYMNFNSSYIENLKKIVSYSNIILPNYTEACYLTGEEYTEECSDKKWKRIQEKLFQLGAKKIILTSIPVSDNQNIGVGYADKEKSIIKEWKKEKKTYHGTGDIFAGVFSGSYIQGYSLEDCVKLAHEFVSYCIQISSQYEYSEREGVLLEQCLSYLIKRE